MSQLAIVVENLSKHYRINGSGVPAYYRLSEALTGVPKVAWYATSKLLASGYSRAGATEPPALAAGLAVSKNTRGSQATNDFWALKDINFEIKQGEVVGIIGRNGAGKSTLLKILSRITEPTSGKFGVRGRVASLLEVGTGFHPELNGRENIYVSGITLGMTRAEIKKRFDEIVDFSGVEKFLDTPVKHYSSGMQVRLGFAVAAHLESEILIVDEVLAVGDAEFQSKCMARMGNVAKHGRTVLVVTHNMVAVRSLCSQIVWIDKGCLQFQGETQNGINEYNRTVSAPCTKWTPADQAIMTEQSSVTLYRIELLHVGKSQNASFTIESPFELQIDFHNGVDNRLLNVSVLISTLDGVVVFASASPAVRYSAGTVSLQTVVPAHLLNSGTFSVMALIVENESHVLIEIPRALVFELVETERQSSWLGTWPGVVRPRLQWTTLHSDSVSSTTSSVTS